jgi:hypothetical protein
MRECKEREKGKEGKWEKRERLNARGLESVWLVSS